MIVGAEAKSMQQEYQRDAKLNPSKPYVMWPGTPYEHLMLPVKRRLLVEEPITNSFADFIIGTSEFE
jgi:hypothetical protein